MTTLKIKFKIKEGWLWTCNPCKEHELERSLGSTVNRHLERNGGRKRGRVKKREGEREGEKRREEEGREGRQKERKLRLQSSLHPRHKSLFP